MGDKWVNSVAGLLILALCLIALPSPVEAYSISVDGNPSEWAMAIPINDNTGHVGRNGANQGVFVWADYNGDVRADGADPDSNYEITEFHVTADASNLYFLIQFSDITNAALPYVSIAVDTDLASGSGTEYFGDFSDTQTHSDAEWERLIVANTNKTGYYDQTWTWTAAGASYVSDANDIVEISMPFTNLGVTLPATLRFTVVVCQHDGSGGVVEVFGSDALDAITNYGDPGNTSNTWDEVSDGIVDYHFDVYLNASGEPYSPLLIVELLPNGTYEWVEIYNVTVSAISLDGWKVGDEEQTDGTEKMAQFPNGYSIASNDFVVVASQAVGYGTLGYARSASFEFTNSDATPDMVSYTAWSSGSFALANAGDQVLLLDAHDTVMDVVVYGSETYPGVTAITAPGSGVSLERNPVDQDTNDCTEDFGEDPTAVSLAGIAVKPEGFSGFALSITLVVVIGLGFVLSLRQRWA